MPTKSRSSAKNNPPQKSPKSTPKTTSATKRSSLSVFDLPVRDLVHLETGSFSGDGIGGHLLVLGSRVKVDGKKLASLLADFQVGSGWHLEHAEKKLNNGQSVHIGSAFGPIWIVSCGATAADRDATHGGMLQKSPRGLARDRVGGVLGSLREFELAGVNVVGVQLSDAEQVGAVIGLIAGSYRYSDVKKGKKAKAFYLSGMSAGSLAKGRFIGEGMNLARHLVNTPAGDLTPSVYAKTVQDLFKGEKNVTVTVWEKAQLVKEKMGMILGVGAGAEDPPCLIHIRYRPQAAGKKAPIAIVGKGITFDSGGLDKKPPSAMRLMKKDMGGSASAVGTAWWLVQSQSKQPCDFWLAVAENSVDGKSFRPGDVLVARNGLTVEIHNTDAEGRLVLGDGLDVAVTQTGKDKPSVVLDLATLTGAMRVALGTQVGGLFANNDSLASKLESAAMRADDPVWRLPLARDCERDLKSSVADVANAGTSGMGGAISAALFLQKFVRDVPWAHFDIFCWADAPRGALGEVGGSGQAVQLLSEYIS